VRRHLSFDKVCRYLLEHLLGFVESKVHLRISCGLTYVLNDLNGLNGLNKTWRIVPVVQRVQDVQVVTFYHPVLLSPFPALFPGSDGPSPNGARKSADRYPACRRRATGPVRYAHSIRSPPPHARKDPARERRSPESAAVARRF